MWYSTVFYSAYLLNTDLDGGCDQQWSDDHQKFNTHRRTKLTAPQAISGSTDIDVPTKI